MKKILLMGSINMDLVVDVKAMPKVGETIIGDNFREGHGGKGANQGVAIARVGGDITMIGRVGDDLFGRSLLAGLKKEGIGVEGVKEIENTPSGMALISVDKDGNNSIIVAPGANFEIDKSEIRGYEDLYKRSDIIVHQLETPLDVVEESIVYGRSLGKTTILNPAPARELPDSILKNVDYLIPNETELEILSNTEIKDIDDVKKAVKILLGKGVKKVIVTLGEKGSYYTDGSCEEIVSSYKVEAKDTTAAGDSFIGGFVSKIASGESDVEAINYGTKVAAIAVTREGAQDSIPTKEEVEKYKGRR